MAIPISPVFPLAQRTFGRLQSFWVNQPFIYHLLNGLLVLHLLGVINLNKVFLILDILLISDLLREK